MASLSTALTSEKERLVREGFVDRGFATPDMDPGIQTSKVFYLASEVGTYEKFGNIEVGRGDTVLLVYDTSLEGIYEPVWGKVAVGVPKDGSGGSSVELITYYDSGTRIATLNIDGDRKDIFIPKSEGGGAIGSEFFDPSPAINGITLKSQYNYIGVNRGLYFDGNTGSGPDFEVQVVNINDVPIRVLHSRLPIYSDSFISAGGLSNTGGSSGTDLQTVWNSLEYNNDEFAGVKINQAHIPDLYQSKYNFTITGNPNARYDLSVISANAANGASAYNYITNGLYVAGTLVQTSAARDTLLGINSISYNLSTDAQDTTVIEWDSVNNAWHVRGNLYADGWISAAGISATPGQVAGNASYTRLDANGGTITNGADSVDIYSRSYIDNAIQHAGTVQSIVIGNSAPYTPVSGVITIPAYPIVPTNISAFNNDSGYLFSSTAAATYATITALDGVSNRVTALESRTNWDTYFGVDANGNVYVKKKTVGGQEVGRDFYSYGAISAGGYTSGGGASGTSLEAVWGSLTNGVPALPTTTTKISSDHIPIGSGLDVDLSGNIYVTSQGSVTGIKIGSTTYTPTAGTTIVDITNGIPADLGDLTNNAGYIKANQTITLSGDVSGSGTTSINVSIGAGKVTNAMLAGNIDNSKLANSSITIGSTSISLGGTSLTLAGLTSVTSSRFYFNANTYLELDSSGYVHLVHPSGKGFYADGFVSAGGISSGGGTGGIDLDAMWQSLTTTTDSHGTNKIHTGHLPTLSVGTGLTASYTQTSATSTTLNLGINPTQIAIAVGLDNYLPLAGGTLTLSDYNGLKIQTTASGAYSMVRFYGTVNSALTNLGWLGFTGVDNASVWDAAGHQYSIYHSGNSNKSDVAWSAASLTLPNLGQIIGANSASLLYNASSGGVTSVWLGDNGTGNITLRTGTDIIFNTNSTERARINSAGAVYIGGNLRFRSPGSGTYNIAEISCNADSFTIEAPLATDSASGTKAPIRFGWRGGNYPIIIGSNTNVGIGAASYIRAKLDVRDSASREVVNFDYTGTSTYGGYVRLALNDTTAGSLNWNSSAVVLYHTSGNKIVLDSTGVGVGTSSPAYKLDVAGVGHFAAAEADLLILNRTGGSTITWLTYYNAGSLIGRIGTGNGYAYFHNGSTYYQMWHAGNFNPGSYLPLAGGTLNDNAVIKRTGSSVSWVNGRAYPIIRTSSYTGYNAILSMKTTSGSWELGVFSSDTVYLTYITDTNYNSQTNTQTYQLVFPKDIGTVALTKNIPTSLPASDVYAWAKAATKPTYNLDEVADGSTRKLANYVPKVSYVSNYNTWADSQWGFSEWTTNSPGAPESYGTSFNFRDNTTWYWRLMFGTSGRIYAYRGINTTTMTASGTIAYTSDLSSYVPTSRTVNGKALSANITLSLDDVADGSTRKLANYLPLAGGTMSSGAQIVVASVHHSSGNTYNGGIQLREYNYSTTSVSELKDGPGITFHWGGRVVQRLSMSTGTQLYWGDSQMWNAGNSNKSDVNWTCRDLYANRIFLARSANAYYGRIGFYSSAYYTWYIYMTYAGSVSPTAANEPSGSVVTSWALRTLIENASGYGWTWESCANSQNATPVIQMELSSNSGSLVVRGAITAGAASDVRLKTNVNTMSDEQAKALIMALRPVTFTWNQKATELYDQYKGNDLGFVAQEVEGVQNMIPGLSKAIGTIFTDYKRLDPVKFIAPIVKVVQSHEMRIKRLEDENDRIRKENLRLIEENNRLIQENNKLRI